MFNELKSICNQLLYDKQLIADFDICKARLDLELSEIEKQEEAWVFLRFYKAIKNNKIKQIENNEHNLFIWWLLGVCPSVNINKAPAFTEPDYPDCDLDYIPAVRNYLKEEFTFKKYGKEHVCNIASYQTYGIKSSLIDMARVLGYDRKEIISITKELEKLQDDEGEDLTFAGMEEDFILIEEKLAAHKRLTRFEQTMMKLCEYRKTHPDVWDAAKRLVSSDIDWKKFNYGKPPHRKKSMGMHASGLIISSVNLSEFVPLVVPPKSRKLGLQACAWVEGLADTDCSSVGLIKFDYLSLEANAKVAECNRLIMERHGLNSICALPGLSNWSDIRYLNDIKSLEMANAGDLKGVFQFDSPGIRKLVKQGGVTSFDDLVAYSSIYRPSVLDIGGHEEYCNRKNNKKEYEIHPLLKPILEKTYGVQLYQEQTMQILNIVGGIPLKDCESVRKAISKKKKDKIEKYKDMFITNGQKNLGVSKEYVEELYNQIESWSGYGFNKCVMEDVLVVDKFCDRTVSVGELCEEFKESEPCVQLLSYCNNEIVLDEVDDVFETGEKDVYEIEFDNGVIVKCTLDHKFLCSDLVSHTVEEILINDLEIICNNEEKI